MSSAALSVLPLRFTRVTFSLFVLALAALLLPAMMRAQTTYSGGGASFAASDTINPSAVSSTINVSGAPGAVATVKVVLLGVKSDGESFANGPIYNSLAYAEFYLVGPGGSLVLLAGTGDTIDGCDQNQNDDSCDGLQGTISPAMYPDTITIQDGAHEAPNGAGSLGEQYEGWQTADMPYTVKPTSTYISNGNGPPPLPATENTADYPAPDGGATLNGNFVGTTANGPWTLYLIDNNFVGGGTQNDPFSITGWNLILTFASATPTNTVLSTTTSNPAFYANSASSISIAYTATVSSDSGTPTGTVTFQANGSTISGCSGVTLSGGVAHCTVSLAQGDNSITAAYTPTGSFGQSEASLSQMVEVTASNPTGDQWCNNNLISVPANDDAGLAYPSVIKIPNTAYPGKTVANVEVELEDVQGLSQGIGGQYLLVAPGGGAHNFLFFQQGFEDTSASSAVTLTFEDSAGATVPYDTGAPTSGTYLPTDNSNEVNPDTMPPSNSPNVDTSIPQVPGTLNFAPPYGGDTTVYSHTNILTFGEAFNGASADGDWALYTVAPGAVNLNSGWCITLSLNTGTATTTTVSSGQNPGTKGQAVTITATVTVAGGDPVTSGGTVTFTDTTGSTPVTLASNVALNGSGQASFSTSSLTEGDHEITANYSGVTNDDNASFGSMWQRINTATAVTQVSGSEWQYCNPGAVESFYPDPAGPFTPNPSNIFVTNLPGTLNTVAVQLTGFSVPIAENLDELESLVEYVPAGSTTGPALDFFSNTTQGASGNSTAASGTYIFEDSAAGLVSSGNTNLTQGSYKPTAYESFLAIRDSFTSSVSGQYPAPTSFSYAPNTSFGSSSTFADVFTNGSNANGRWSLFFNTTDGAQGTIGAANGWCVNLTENLPTVSISASHSGNFTQGEQDVPLTVTVTNNGAGSTGDPAGGHPLTVTDTLPTGLSYAGSSGSGWSCSGSGPVTCTNDSAIGDGDQYPALTIDVNVADNAPASVTNDTGASGGGAGNAPTSNDTITITPAPVFSVSEGYSGTFTQGQTGGILTVTVSNTAGATSTTQGATTVTETLPTGYSAESFSSGRWSCSGTSSVTCTSTQQVAGGAAFDTISIIVFVPTGAANPTTTSAATASGGGALSSATSGTVTFPVVQVPYSIALTSGNSQSTPISTPFATALSVTVKDAGSNPINNSSVTFTAPSSGPSGTFSNSSTTITVNTNGSGIANAGTFTANAIAGGTYTVTVGAGSANGDFSLTNTQPPAITSASSTSFTVGTAGSFTVTASGYPSSITFSATGALPSGVTLTTAGLLSGTPAAGTGGSYPITITASNGVSPAATQSFTLTVNQPPAITSAGNATFTAGTAGSFTVTATGNPTPTVSETGTLPSGVTFSGGTFSGTPATGSGGSYPFTITASNGVGANATQTFTLTVDQAPAFTSANSTTFTTNAAGSFSITASPGYPTNAATLVVSNVLNAVPGVNLPSSGTGSISVGGTPTAPGVETFTITATNGAGLTATQSFTLTVNQPPANALLTVTAVNISKIVGTANPTFTASYSGFVNGDTAAVLSGSPALSTTATTASPVGTYPIAVAQGTLTAANYTFTFVPGTLNVVAAPTIVLTTSAPLSGSASAGYTATVTVTNNGSGAASNVTLTGAALGSVSGTPLPQTLGTLAAGGGTATVTVNFPGSAGANGAAVVEKISGSYTGGTFSASVHATLP
jgi:hypothetical protein